MAKDEMLAGFILRMEGGFVNDPTDAGGATNMGVTLATFKEYRRRKGMPAPSIEELRHLRKEEWHDIFKTLYWDRWKGDLIYSDKVALILVDWLWGSGRHGITIPQRMLGVSADGIVGPKTIEAVNNANPDTLFQKLCDARASFFREITVKSILRFEKRIGRISTPSERIHHTNQRFLKGWLRRNEELRRLGDTCQ